MRQALAIARLTLVEASRRRLLLAMALLTLAVIVLTGWGFS
ncbi:MAG: ABC transporter permease, partial [Chloroflexi bacterium]